MQCITTIIVPLRQSNIAGRYEFTLPLGFKILSVNAAHSGDLALKVLRPVLPPAFETCCLHVMLDGPGYDLPHDAVCLGSVAGVMHVFEVKAAS